MSQSGWMLVFKGEILADFERPHVMAAFGDAFRLSTADVERIFNHPRVVLKRGLSDDEARRVAARLSDIGMVTHLRPSSPPRAKPPQDAAPAVAPATALALVDLPATPAPSGDAETVTGPAVRRVLPPTPAAASADTPTDAPADISASVPPGPPPDTTLPTEADAQAERRLVFSFGGEGFEFFRIWIVNLLLTIVTLGIYSAWAKVRTHRYFYGNTRLDGDSFDYLASPIAILKGRLIGFGLLLVYLLSEQFLPLLNLLLIALLVLGIPWITVRGLAFQRHNSAWRGVRFSFQGRLATAYWVFLLLPILGILTLGLLMPFTLQRQQRYILDNTRYGQEPLSFCASASAFYVLVLTLIGALLGAIALAVLLGKVFAPIGILAMVAGYIVIGALFAVKMANLTLNNTLLATHRFQGNYALGSYLRLMVVNTVAMVLTLGLFYPWASVRTARYAAAHSALLAYGDLDHFVAVQRREESAVGGEIGELFDVGAVGL